MPKMTITNLDRVQLHYRCVESTCVGKDEMVSVDCGIPLCAECDEDMEVFAVTIEEGL